MTEPTAPETPDSILDLLRTAPDLSAADREVWFNRLVARFPSADLLGAGRRRLDDLSGEDAEATLRIIEAFGDQAVHRELAEAVGAQPDLPPSHAWAALSLLDAAGILDEFPALLDWWADLNEVIAEEDASLESLAEHLEEEPGGSVVALHGLVTVEPEVRAEIIAGLADLPGGPGLISFLRMLAFAHDPATRSSALDALDARSDDEPGVLDAWRSIARTHTHPGVVERALTRLGDRLDSGASVPSPLESPRLVRSLVTAVDGEGRATIVLAALDGSRWAGAAFLCHVLHGVIDVIGHDGMGLAGLDEAFEALNDQSASDVLEGSDILARTLLAGCLTLCGPATSPALRYWVERTLGTHFRAETGVHLFVDETSSASPFEPRVEDARLVLDASPRWVDTSEIARDLAREIRLREPGASPDPRRDSGAYRYVFEHRLASRIDLYQRMLLWMAAFWRASGESELGRAALSLAWQLADPQHAVPSHPFFVELTTRSLAAASD